MNYAGFLPGGTLPFHGMSAVLFALLIAWSFIWKGLALWRSARRKDTAWFVIFMILNTVGILEIIYYFIITKVEEKKEVDKGAK